ncbi:GDP-mannose mannosyl hydrolase [Alteromonas alba]|uniref:GDP-mannose mannosyl hydrolase n=1 Tax=Alteromonas alba TaxID=2079529 RepID=A0A2S9VE09_9ALTE|nr:GDP-mannose mannosyl hydrolase [Alteromonas alba]PRO74698.1 GDP-mannose mannosyl hydrolase [Alteromonas alba]
MAFLSESTYQTIIGATPLVSIDLIVKNAKGEVLLGYRTNRPAQGYWFVPGGRVQKNEKLDKAFLRLTEAELGIAIERSAANFMGVFEHLYEDSAFDESVSTHYVVLGYELNLDIALDALPKEQHNQYAWMASDELLKRDDVHVHTKWYVE